MDLRNLRIVVAGPTGQVGNPVARALAKDNEVLGVARFTDAEAKASLEADGIRCIPADLASGDFGDLPRDVDVVLNFSVAKGHDFDTDLAANAEGIGLLMSHCRHAKAVLHCSSTAVYESAGRHRCVETDPLGDDHRSLLPTYSISKIAAEAVARYACRDLGIPTIITRLCVPYGNNGGWPYWHLLMLQHGVPVEVNPDQPNEYNLIHEDDILAMLPKLLDAASVPATIVNWAGDEVVSIEEWVAELGRLIGKDASVVTNEQALDSVTVDLTKLHAIAGRSAVPWRDGLRRMVEAKAPELLVG